MMTDTDTTPAENFDVDSLVEKAIREGTEPETVESTPESDEDVNLPDEARFARWQARRPRIEHLSPAVVSQAGERNPDTGLLASVILPLFDVGDRIVVDVRTTFLPSTPWLHTLVGKVRSIDDDTGVVSLYDEDSDPRCPMVRWVSFKDGLHDFRLAPAKGNPFNAEKVKPVRPPPAPGEERRGRGRPKGSKNRPKEEIKAEREAYKAAQAVKKGRKA